MPRHVIIRDQHDHIEVLVGSTTWRPFVPGGAEPLTVAQVRSFEDRTEAGDVAKIVGGRVLEARTVGLE